MPNDFRIPKAIGDCYRREENYLEALKNYDESIEKFEEDVDASKKDKAKILNSQHLLYTQHQYFNLLALKIIFSFVFNIDF